MSLHGAATGSAAALQAALAEADVAMGVAAAGVQVASAATLAAAKHLRVAVEKLASRLSKFRSRPAALTRPCFARTCVRSRSSSSRRENGLRM